jgi:hypothetical protein
MDPMNGELTGKGLTFGYDLSAPQGVPTVARILAVGPVETVARQTACIRSNGCR